jgi:hypothetical protein
MSRMKMLAATAMVGLFATSGFAEVEKIAKIDVTADLSAIQNTEAAAYWANLEVDLENAIAARVTDRLMSEDEAKPTTNGNDNSMPVINGTQIVVDIREVELANAFQRELNLGDAVLVGQVNIKDDADSRNIDAYELSVSLETAQVVVPEGTTLVLSADTAESYTRLVDSFADNVVSRLK